MALIAKSYKKTVTFVFGVVTADISSDAVQIPIVTNATASNPSDEFTFSALIRDSTGLQKGADYVFLYNKESGILTVDSAGSAGDKLANLDTISVIGTFYK